MCLLFQLIFEIPSNRLMILLGSTNYLSLAMILWGSITIGMAFVTNGPELIALRGLVVS